jgi:isocitrate dehydrogenase
MLCKLIEDGIARTIQQKKVTYDLERLTSPAKFCWRGM